MANIDTFLARVEIQVNNETYDFEECKTRDDPVGPFFKEDVVAALLTSRRNLSKAARLLGKRRGNLVRYIEGNKEVLEFFDEMLASNIDDIEETQINLAVLGDGAAGRFMLERQARERGYNATLEVAADEGLRPVLVKLMGVKADGTSGDVGNGAGSIGKATK